ncbi:MAG TPA: hypothetical protein PLP03_09065 [Bacteroidales bacterium]|nr:hypothetical protein [Bacteroidales bacterium]
MTRQRNKGDSNELRNGRVLHILAITPHRKAYLASQILGFFELNWLLLSFNIN